MPLSTRDVETLIKRLSVAITILVFVVFGWLAERHVGESVFLEDQVYLLQNFESLLRLKPEGLWGPAMSDTTPPARALGPISALVFGLPISLGLGIDSIHAFTSLLISLGAAAAFLALARIDRPFAWLWFAGLSATGIVWWNAALFWSNTLLLSTGLALFALAASCLWSPSLGKLALLTLTGLFALQLHLIAVVAVPVILVVGGVTWSEARDRLPNRRTTSILLALGVAAIGPYILAEVLTGFRNTRAILIHLQATGTGPRWRAVETAASTLAIVADPTQLSRQTGLGAAPALAVGAVLTTLGLFLFGRDLRGHLLKPPMEKEKREEWVIFWLIVSAVIGAIGQALFFVWTTRPLAGFHYVTLLSPYYPVVPAALLRRLVPDSSRASLALGAACLVFLLAAAPALADHFLPPTRWSYKQITAALDALCAGVTVDTAEGSGFAAQVDPKYEGVLRYLMNRRLSKCRYQQGSPILIAAGQDGLYEEWRTVGNLRYRLELVLPPGIARYRRWP